ncbi:hypothetical protein [Vibrio scophthalmi]|uniref:Lipoprotein n=1 Tax=Vibrio scophthalmi LMG 19158 TaxID=870967 RepID=F9RIE7_9VIBR|nr:hypothetical protein [Vibrio scophthalmi]EGU42479.1 hypothetical protein VIS19158_11798 [Vibrio scophthalmi LMG 19158]
MKTIAFVILTTLALSACSKSELTQIEKTNDYLEQVSLTDENLAFALGFVAKEKAEHCEDAYNVAALVTLHNNMNAMVHTLSLSKKFISANEFPAFLEAAKQTVTCDVGSYQWASDYNKYVTSSLAFSEHLAQLRKNQKQGG